MSIVYQNNRNCNKFVEVKKSKCGHYYIRQFQEWGFLGVRNYVGHKKGGYDRLRKSTMQDILADYHVVGVRGMSK